MLQTIFLDADECQVTCRGRNTVCHNTYGSYDCNCQEGFIWGVNGIDCEGMNKFAFDLFENTTLQYRIATHPTDIDECEMEHQCNTTSEICVNTIGSYVCKCKEGYENNTQCEGMQMCCTQFH